MNKYIDQSINAISDRSYSAEVDYTENQFKTPPPEYNVENNRTANSKSGAVKGQVNAMINNFQNDMQTDEEIPNEDDTHCELKMFEKKPKPSNPLGPLFDRQSIKSPELIQINAKSEADLKIKLNKNSSTGNFFLKYKIEKEAVLKNNEENIEENKPENLQKDNERNNSNAQSSKKVVPVVENQQDNSGDIEAKADEEEDKKPRGEEERKQSGEEDKKPSGGLFGGMLSGLNDNIGDVEGPAKDNWQFCVFQIRKRKYNILKNGISSKLNIPLGPGDESLIMCLNFSDKELKTLLVDMLKINPIIYYECMLLSPVDKVYEFDDGSIFYNMVINRENFMDAPLILRMIRKSNFGVVVMNQAEGDKFMLSTEIATKFKFKEIIKPPFPKLFAKRRQKKRAELKAKALLDQAKAKPIEDEEDTGKKVIGGVIIQKIRTIMPMNDQEITIDYLLFWISSEGLMRIENFFNLYLLNEVCEIQEQSRELTMEEEEYLNKIDVFEDHYIAAQNAKGSKEQYFEKIIESEMASENFRYLIRHLSSRMLNLSNTTFVIENKLSLSRNTYQMAVDTKMTENSEKLDKLMRQFSLVSIMFLPLTIITGMWGMNCKVPYMMVDEETDNNLNCFYVLCAVMIGIVIFLLTFFKLIYF